MLKRIKLAIATWVANRKAAKKAAVEARDVAIQEIVNPKLECKDIRFFPRILMGKLLGYYTNGSITVSSGVHGLLLADTLFHEDRHYRQELAKHPGLADGVYIQAKEDYPRYYEQHVEKDARRYAYVQVCRHFSDDRKMWIYKPIFHPYKGALPRATRLYNRYVLAKRKLKEK